MPVASSRPASHPVPSRLWRWTAAALASATWLGACGGTADTASGPATGGTLVIVQPVEPQTLFPPRAEGTEEIEVINAVFDRLAEIGPNLDAVGDSGFVPRLASKWTWASDSMSLAFTLDPKSKWHDGAPVRAEDVRYSFHVYTSDAVGSANKSLLGNIDSVSTPDSLTAVFWFKRRTPQQFLDATYNLFVLPSHILSKLPDSSLANSPFARTPVGTGRFRFARWDAGAALEITADTANVRGRAKLDRVIWTFVSDNGAAAVKLFAGEADLFTKIRSENIEQMASAPQLRLETNLPLVYGFLGFNLQSRRAPRGSNSPHPVLGDVRVRRAFAMAMDRAKMVRSALDTLGMVSLAPAPRALIPDTAALKQIPFDVAGAKALLDSAGWKDTNSDGVRDMNGKKLGFEILIPSSSVTRKNMGVLVQAALKEIGAEVTLQVVERANIGARIEAFDFDAYMGGYQANPGLQGLRQTWVSTGEYNVQGYRSATFDAEVDSALTGFDLRKSKTHFTRAFQTAIDEVPSVWLYEERQPIAVHRRFRIAPLRADGWSAYLADWSVDPSMRIDRDKVGLGGAR